MKPRLFTFKRDELEHYDSRNRIYFVVVNLDKAKKYPANFVCILPKVKKSMVKLKTEFSRVFGKDSLRLAKKLLNEALADEDDAEIRTEIQERLKFL
jgi:predicted transport protein